MSNRVLGNSLIKVEGTERRICSSIDGAIWTSEPDQILFFRGSYLWSFRINNKYAKKLVGIRKSLQHVTTPIDASLRFEINKTKHILIISVSID